MVRFTIALAALFTVALAQPTVKLVEISDERQLFEKVRKYRERNLVDDSKEPTILNSRRPFCFFSMQIPSLFERATNRLLELSTAGDSSNQDICQDPGLSIEMDENLKKVLSTIVNYDGLMEGLQQFATEGITVGSTTALIAEASDAAVSGATIADGESGDIDFPHGNLKPIATGGERSVCPSSFGLKITGTPDGLGAYLPNDDTIRVVVQSEGYGPLRIES